MHLKLSLYLYELMSGLKINYMKSEIFVINGTYDTTPHYVELFDCQFGVFPMKYLGVHVSPSRLHVSDWNKLEEKNDKRLQSWKGSALSIAGRITLINSCMTNTPIYHMSMYLLSKTTVKKWTPSGENFFGRVGDKKKYHLIN